MSSMHAHERLVERAWRAFFDRDFEDMFQVVSEDAVFHPSTSSAPLEGRREIEAFWTGQRERGVDVVAVAHHMAVEGDTVLVTGVLRVREPDGGLADRQVQWRFHIGDGRIVAAEAVRGR